MVEIPLELLEQLSETDKLAALGFATKIKNIEDEWLSVSEELFPIRMKIVSLVKSIDIEQGYVGTGFEKLIGKIKFALNIGGAKQRVKEAQDERARLKEENKALYEKEAELKEKLEDAEFNLGCILYPTDITEAKFFAMSCKDRRDEVFEAPLKKFRNEYK